MQNGRAGDGSRANPPATAEPVRYSLLPDTVVFTGRASEVEFITGAVAAARNRGGVMSCTIDGMPGLGKTALAIHVAHLLPPQFADRQRMGAAEAPGRAAELDALAGEQAV